MRKLIPALLIALVCAGCVSSPAQKAPAPAWVLSTPAPDATYTYFVASSSDERGDAALATEDAAAALISQITRFMGVTVTVETTGIARGSLDEYSAEVTSVVRQQGTSRIAGFSVKDRYESREGSRITVYILAQYVTADLNREKARIAALFREREDAVSRPEAAGDAAVAAGRAFDAIKSYVEAAVAASGSDIDNADVKMERNVNKARTVLGRLRFVRVDAPSVAALGRPFPKPFQAKLVYGEGDAAPGVPGAEVFMVYQTRNAAGRTLTRTERGLTDANGVVSFAPPPPDFVGRASFTFRLSFDALRDLMDRIPVRYDAYVQALADDMGRRLLSFDYSVTSAAKDVATGVVVIDLAGEGAAATTSVAQGALFEVLAREKFKAGLAPLDAALIISGDDARIIEAARRQYSPALGRVIYGTALVTQAAKDGTMWTASARMSVKVVDLANGMVLYATEKLAMAVGADEAAARRAALQQVAREAVAKDLMTNLP